MRGASNPGPHGPSCATRLLTHRWFCGAGAGGLVPPKTLSYRAVFAGRPEMVPWRVDQFPQTNGSILLLHLHLSLQVLLIF